MRTGAGMLCLAAVLAVPLLRADAPWSPNDVRFEQKIGQSLPLSTVFTDTAGRRRPLGDFFQGRPEVLYFGYARCPQLCSVVGDGVVAALRRLPTSAGRDFGVVAISIDPDESADDAKSRRTESIDRYGREGADAGWHYLRGDSAAIRAVTAAAGFHFVYDPRSRQYAHPSGFVVATPKGVVSRYFLGVDFSVDEVRTALAQAGRDQTGPTVLSLLLVCFRGSGIGGRYGALIWRTLWAAVALTVAALAGGVGWMLRQERRRRPGPREDSR